MTDKLKSSFELAMERLRQKDAERGEKQVTLGRKEKEEIAALRRFYQAKLAEREIAWQSERRKLAAAAAGAAADPEAAEAALRTAEEAFRRDREKLERERDSKIEAVRGKAGR